MPYSIEKRGDSYAVKKKDDGRVMGIHPSKQEAEDQIQAIYASENRKKNA